MLESFNITATQSGQTLESCGQGLPARGAGRHFIAPAVNKFNKPFMVKLTNRSEWDRGILPTKQDQLIWYIDEVTGAMVYDHGKKELS